MKKHLYLIGILIISILLCSCNNRNLADKKDLFSPGNLVFPQEKNNFITTQLPNVLEEGFCLNTIRWLDDNNLLLVIEDIKETEHKKILIYNIIKNTKEYIYDGRFYGDWTKNHLKLIDDEYIGLQTDNKFIIFDKKTLKLIKELAFSFDYAEADVSNDGSKIAYTTDDSIYIYDIKQGQSNY